MNENEIDELCESLNDVHIYEPEIESYTFDEYQEFLDNEGDEDSEDNSDSE